MARSLETAPSPFAVANCSTPQYPLLLQKAVSVDDEDKDQGQELTRPYANWDCRSSLMQSFGAHGLCFIRMVSLFSEFGREISAAQTRKVEAPQAETRRPHLRG